MRYVKAFGKFWYDFIVGDDWTIAAMVLVAAGATYWLAHAGIVAWWLMPVAAVLTLAVSTWRLARQSGRGG